MATCKYFMLYDYQPSFVAAIVFVVLFGLLTVLHLAQMCLSRAWFMTAFIVGGTCKDYFWKSVL